MDSPFSFRDTSMVFHAPLQRRHGGTYVSGVRANSPPHPHPEPPSRATSTDHLFPGRRFRVDDRDERSYSPLPALPTVLRSQSHLRVVPTADVTPVRSLYNHARVQPKEITMQPSSGKASLGFILGDSRTPTHIDRRMVDRKPIEDFDYAPPTQRDYIRVASDSSLPTMASSSYSSPSALIRPSVPVQSTTYLVDMAASTEKKKRKARICTTEGCTKYVVDHGLCIRHGGGKRCYIDGCDCRAQNRGLCWKHGGFTICKVEGCTKRAKSRGICWSHGGGTRCKRDDCSKIAVSSGLCWAHGGGKRCVFGKCRKPASERTNNYCNEHFAIEDNGNFDDSA